jgi:hypothetical protein
MKKLLLISSSSELKRFLLILLSIIAICGQTAAAFTSNDFICAEEGDFGGTCFYDPGSACSASSTSFGPGTLPSYIKQPYNSIFTAAAAKYNINPAALVALFYNEQYGYPQAQSAFNNHEMPTPPPPYGNGAPWSTSRAGAEGPFQFIPSTWASWAVNANGQGGTPNPEDLADAAFTAAHALSGGGFGGIKLTSSSSESEFITLASYYFGAAAGIPNTYGQVAGSIYGDVIKDEGSSAGTSGGVTTTGCASSSGGGNCILSSGSILSSPITGNEIILCEAEQYKGIYYLSGGGHVYSTFKEQCSSAVLASASSSSTAANPGPCATDCSGLVSVAVDMAFNQNFSWDVAGIETDSADWESIPISSVQPGDVVTQGTNTHVEIVDHYDSSSNTLYTFGSHASGQRTSEVSSTPSYWTGGAYRYIGPGSAY